MYIINWYMGGKLLHWFSVQSNQTSNMYFFISSEYEKSCWRECSGHLHYTQYLWIILHDGSSWQHIQCYYHFHCLFKTDSNVNWAGQEWWTFENDTFYVRRSKLTISVQLVVIWSINPYISKNMIWPINILLLEVKFGWPI